MDSRYGALIVNCQNGRQVLMWTSNPKPLPNMRMKLSWRGGRLKGKGSILMAAAAPRSLCAIR